MGGQLAARDEVKEEYQSVLAFNKEKLSLLDTTSHLMDKDGNTTNPCAKEDIVKAGSLLYDWKDMKLQCLYERGVPRFTQVALEEYKGEENSQTYEKGYKYYAFP